MFQGKIEAARPLYASDTFPEWSTPPETDNPGFLALTIATRARSLGLEAHIEVSHCRTTNTRETHYLAGFDGDGDWEEREHRHTVVHRLEPTRYVWIGCGNVWLQIRIADHPQTAHSARKYGRPNLDLVLPRRADWIMEWADRTISMALSRTGLWTPY